MADDDFNFDFENSLEPPQNNQQVSFDPKRVRSSGVGDLYGYCGKAQVLSILFAIERCANSPRSASWGSYWSVYWQLQKEL